MGILNITPDSFYDGGKYSDDSAICHQVEKMLNEEADIIDIGGYSSRPGAKDISEQEELNRVLPTIRVIQNQFKDILISVDTFRSSVANQSLKEGAFLINDISGGVLDNQMLNVIAEHNCPFVMMHMVGTPQNMSQHTQYKDVTTEVISELNNRVEDAKKLNIKNIIIDPGFGFSKTLDQNYEILRNLDKFTELNLPILVGLSRKSMIYKKLNSHPDNALTGSIALQTAALLKGAKILRVHDVKEAKETITLINEIN